jgi:membrane fusion protein, copper/silver efflux system
MKALLLFVSLFVAPLLLLGCGEEESHDHAEGQLYTCGMHPQVVQDTPGTCPICGMNLTPMKTATESSDPGEREVLYWQAPMDPTYIRDEPGKSPMGMDLVPVYADEGGGGSDHAVYIDSVVVQNMGVRTQIAKKQTVFRHLRTIGEVEVGEDELSVVNLRYSGWIEKLYVDRTGDPVKAGQALFEIYSPELVGAQEDYLLALRTQGADSELAKSSRRRLELWDISTYDIDRIRDSGEVRRTLPVRSPQAGFVLHKDVVEGARVNAGKDLYRIGNLQRIWVTAEVYEFDAPWVAVGQPAQMELTYDKGTTLEGEVSYIYPTLDPTSRTLTVRLEFENTGLELKPGMFATVYIEYRRLDDVLAIPSEAILHSGTREIVFVDVGEGHFEPREVRTGLVGDRNLTEVLSGVEAGEEIVASGQFLIDSESQLQEALRKMLAPEAEVTTEASVAWTCPMHPEVHEHEAGRCPECGMDLVEMEDTPHEALPGQYTCPMHPEVISEEPGRCPECGMFLKEVE